MLKFQMALMKENEMRRATHVNRITAKHDTMYQKKIQFSCFIFISFVPTASHSIHSHSFLFLFYIFVFFFRQCLPQFFHFIRVCLLWIKWWRLSETRSRWNKYTHKANQKKNPRRETEKKSQKIKIHDTFSFAHSRTITMDIHRIVKQRMRCIPLFFFYLLFSFTSKI